MVGVRKVFCVDEGKTSKGFMLEDQLKKQKVKETTKTKKRFTRKHPKRKNRV